MNEALQETRAAPTKTTRAQAIREMVEIRLAVDEAGPLIAGILKANGIDLEADWSKVFPHWLIATVDDNVIGCCQVLPSQPVGYVEFLMVHPEVPFKLRAIALRKLMQQAITTIYLRGAQYVGGVVAKENRKFADVIEKMGFVKTYSADILVKRLV
jgi:hypothetical protein